ncbi:MAG: DUF4276 family protein [Chloroflexi bacterium]|nr:DUF4276 family protein [Chloroflexota bacterium]
MQRVLVLVEGQTEERFLKDLLRPHMSDFQLHLVPTIVTTKIVKQGPNFKGGVSIYRKIERDLQRLLFDTEAIAITTFFDYYGLPHDCPGMDSRPNLGPIDQAIHVETAWRAHVNDPRFRPYLMVHEFEALLFSEPQSLAQAVRQPNLVGQFADIRRMYDTPEHINDGVATSPSKRIKKVAPGFSKLVDGANAAKMIGLDTMREECVHFAKWVDWLEELHTQVGQ